MRSSYLSKFISVIIVIFLLVTVSGTFATWKYATIPISSEKGYITLKMDVFSWEGSEVLPDDEEEGLVHAVLIENIINGEGIGLNSPDSYLNDQLGTRKNIWRRDTLGSMAVTQGNALNDLFNLESQNVEFLIQMKNDSTYYIFTTSIDLGENGSPNFAIGETISPIYRTTVNKVNGKWEAVITEEGSAKSAYYEESRLLNPNKTKIPCFNPNTWQAI